MQKVYKYPLPSSGCLIPMPQGAKILKVDMQGEVICLWAHVDTTQKLENRQFLMAGTGHTLPDGLKLQHHGSLILHEATLVIHVFENLDYTEQQRGTTN